MSTEDDKVKKKKRIINGGNLPHKHLKVEGGRWKAEAIR